MTAREGWTIPAGPLEKRAAHYYRPDSPLFPRLRSLCGGFSLPEPIPLYELHQLAPPGARVTVCGPCATGAGALSESRATGAAAVLCDKCPNLTTHPESVTAAGRTLQLCARCAGWYRRLERRFQQESERA